MTAICLLVYVLCAVYLTVAGGHRAETEEITLLWTDRIPNDLHLLLSGSLVILGLAAAAGLPAQILDATQGFQKLLMLAGVGCAMGAGGVLLEWLTSVARNVKRRQFWRNTLIVKFFRFLKKVGNAFEQRFTISKRISKRMQSRITGWKTCARRFCFYLLGICWAT